MCALSTRPGLLWEGLYGATLGEQERKDPKLKEKGQCVHLSSLSSWEISLAFWELPSPMPWEPEGTGAGELQTCLPASLGFLLAVGWLTCLALRLQLRLCASAEPRHPADVTHAQGLECSGGGQA